MINWKKHFKPYELNYAESALKNGDVKVIEVHTDAITLMSVKDGEDALCELEGLRSNAVRYICFCDKATKTTPCKHVACGLAIWEEFYDDYPLAAMRGILPQNIHKGDPVFLYDKNVERDRLMVHIPSVLPERQFLQEDIQAGQLLVSHEQVILDGGKPEITREWNDTVRFSAKAQVKDEKGKRIGFISIHGRKDSLYKWNCSCCKRTRDNSYYSYEKHDDPCLHIAAMAILLDRYFCLFNPDSKTDSTGYRFIEAFGAAPTMGNKEKRHLEDGRTPCVQLVARIEGDKTSPMLSFRIGKTKLFVVKNMTDLVNAVRSSGVYELGKKDAIFFDRETFLPESVTLFNILKKAVTDGEYLQYRYDRFRNLYDRIDFHTKRTIALNGSVLDAFYDAMQGKEVETYSSSGGYWETPSLMIGDSNPRVSLLIKPIREKKKLVGITIAGYLPFTIQGDQHKYFLTDDHLSVLSHQHQVLLPLFNAAENSNMLTLAIGEKDLPTFYYEIYPKLEESPYVNIDFPEITELEALMPSRPVIGFYLDADEQNLFCKGQVAYGDVVVPLEDPGTWKLPLASYRDPSQEMAAFSAMRAWFPDYTEETKTYSLERNPELIYPMLSDGVRQLMEFGEVHITKEFENLKVHRIPKVTVGVSLSSGLMDLSIATDELSTSELLDLLTSYKQKKKFHRLKNGDFISLESDDTMDALLSVLASSGMSVSDFVDGKMHLPLYRALYVNFPVYGLKAKNIAIFIC